MLTVTRIIATALLATAVGLFLDLIAKSTTPAPAAARKAVIVELFTSEGCSSCPPADALLGELRHGPAAGVEIIPLGFHVDYWNHLGWQDRFSSSAYSRRQEDYARRFRINGPYTPQMVVDGAEEFVGNAERRASAAIAHAASQPAAADVQLSWAGPEKLDVGVSAPGLNSGDVLLAVTEDNLSTQVAAGENNGRALRHFAVVRDFKRLGRVKNGAFAAGVPLKMEKDWKRNDLRVVVFVQAPDEGRIAGAAALALR
ncbi:MAG TPA: DUF1223 domain-containing protein [Candidatus Angelobacter sp.]